MKLHRVFLVLGCFAFANAVSLCGDAPGEAEKPRPEDPREWPSWYVQKRMAEAERVGGEKALCSFISEELRESLYSRGVGRENWNFALIGRAGRIGAVEVLPVLEEWLDWDMHLQHPEKDDLPNFWPYVSRAWLAIKRKHCRDREEYKASVKSLLDVTREKPRLYLLPEDMLKELKEFLPESREWVYDALRADVEYRNKQFSWKLAMDQVLQDAAFKPTRDEKVAVFTRGGQVGRYVMYDVLWGEEAYPSLRQFERWVLYESRNLQLSREVVSIMGACIRTHPDVLDELLRYGRGIMSEPLSEERELVKLQVVKDMDAILDAGVRKRVVVFLREVLEKNPELESEAVKGFTKRPGVDCAFAADGILESRKQLRATASRLLKEWELRPDEPKF